MLKFLANAENIFFFALVFSSSCDNVFYYYFYENKNILAHHFALHSNSIINNSAIRTKSCTSKTHFIATCLQRIGALDSDRYV